MPGLTVAGAGAKSSCFDDAVDDIVWNRLVLIVADRHDSAHCLENGIRHARIIPQTDEVLLNEWSLPGAEGRADQTRWTGKGAFVQAVTRVRASTVAKLNRRLLDIPSGRWLNVGKDN